MLSVRLQPLPGMLLRQHEEPARKRIRVQVAPDGLDALVLLFVEHAVKLVESCKQAAIAVILGILAKR